MIIIEKDGLQLLATTAKNKGTLRGTAEMSELRGGEEAVILVVAEIEVVEENGMVVVEIEVVEASGVVGETAAETEVEGGIGVVTATVTGTEAVVEKNMAEGETVGKDRAVNMMIMTVGIIIVVKTPTKVGPLLEEAEAKAKTCSINQVPK